MFPLIQVIYTIAGAFAHMAHGEWVTGYVHGWFVGTYAVPKPGPVIIVHHTKASTLYAMRHGYECTRGWLCTPSQIPGRVAQIHYHA